MSEHSKGVSLSTIEANNQRYKCDICENTFSQKYTLTRHKYNVHAEEKRHTCEACGKKFATFSNLERHNNDVHRGIRHFVCPDCPQEFSRLANLKRHQERGKHTFEFCCDHCDEKFTFNSEVALKKFFREKHLIGQYDAQETCENAINIPEEKKVQLLRRRIESERKESAEMRAGNTWRPQWHGDYNEYLKKLIEESKEGLDDAMKAYIEEAKKYWWWSKTKGMDVKAEVNRRRKKRKGPR